MRPLHLGAKALALAFLAVAVMALATNVDHPFSADFLSFWAASVLTLDGSPAAAYDLAAHKAVEARIVPLTGLMPFFYPPPFLLIVLPFGLFSYWAAAILWVGTTFAAYIAAARRLLPGAGWLAAAYPAAIVNAIIGQNGFLTAALFIAGLTMLPKRPFLAGLLFGCLIVKPHLAVLLPIAFIAARQWRAFAGAALSSAGLLVLGLLLFGPAAYSAWIDQAPVYASILKDGLVGWHKMASVYASLRLAGAPVQLAWAAHIAIALLAAAAVWLTWRRDCDPAARGAVLAAATLLISPYLYLYDTLILVVCFFWLLTVEKRHWLLATLWCVPLIGVIQNWHFSETINLTPLVSIAVLALACRHIFVGQSTTAGGRAASKALA